MSKDSQSLESLRRDIDAIDDALHDLLKRRAHLIDGIGRAKAAGGTSLRPGREASVLRRLLARHDGPFPKESLVRIWREIMGALVGLQRPFAIAAESSCAVAARDHFGMAWPLSLHAGPGQVVREVADGKASVGIVPLPGPEGQEPWWLALNSEAANLPRIVARLPFVAPPPGTPEALVVACCPPEETGLDRTLFAVETVTDTSRDRLRALLGEKGFDNPAHLSHRRAGAMIIHLAEVDGFIHADDPRLAALSAREPVLRVTILGGYATQSVL